MITFNELEKVKAFLNDENIYPSIGLSDLKLIAKYYKFMDLNIKNNLKNYIRSKTYNYDEVKYDAYIDKCIAYCKKYKLMTNNKLPLTKKENLIIKNIENNDCRKLMFIILMYAKNCKINSIYYIPKDTNKLFFNGNIRELFRFAKIPYKANINDIMLLKELEDLKLVKWGFGNWCEILFYDYCDNDIEIQFNANDNIICYAIGLDSTKYKLKLCPDCGDWFYILKNNTKTKLCNTCNKKNKDLKNKERVQKHRKNIT